MSSEILIRLASVEDLAAVNEIYNYYVLNSTCTYQEAPSSTGERRRWFDAHDARHPIVVAECGDEIVGFGALSPFRERSAFGFTVEDAVYVRHDRTGRGIGGEILTDLIQRARAIGLHAIIAVIDAEQAGSIGLHEGHGFVRCGELRGVGFKFGRWLNCVYLEYLLDSR